MAGDFDTDGDEDIAVANGHVVHHPRNAPALQQPLLLANDRGGFHDISKDAGPYFLSDHAGRGLASGDLNRDGDLDLVFANTRAPAAVLLNETKTSGSSLSLRLIGRGSNRDGIGARAVLRTQKGERSHFIVGGGSYLSTSDLALHFGVPAGDEIRELEVFWPGGDVTRLTAEQIRLLEKTPGRPHALVENLSGAATDRLISLP